MGCVSCRCFSLEGECSFSRKLRFDYLACTRVLYILSHSVMILSPPHKPATDKVSVLSDTVVCGVHLESTPLLGLVCHTFIFKTFSEAIQIFCQEKRSLETCINDADLHVFCLFCLICAASDKEKGKGATKQAAQAQRSSSTALETSLGAETHLCLIITGQKFLRRLCPARNIKYCVCTVVHSVHSSCPLPACIAAPGNTRKLCGVFISGVSKLSQQGASPLSLRPYGGPGYILKGKK